MYKDIHNGDPANAAFDLQFRLKHIAVLTMLVLVLGIGLIATTVAISKDGVIYIEKAMLMDGATTESDIVSSMSWLECQPPGYPVLIRLTHNMLNFFSDGEGVQHWVLSAQVATLMSRLIAVVMLYLLGCYLVKPNASFVAMLVLACLPYPMVYGSDALSEWPFLMMCSAFLVLLMATRKCRSPWFFVLTGLMAGLAYLFRAEGVGLVLVGIAWLVYRLNAGLLSKGQTVLALMLLLGAFVGVTAPYMLRHGYIFPEQKIFNIENLMGMSETAQRAGVDIIGSRTVLTCLSELLMYYFLPPLAVGLYVYFLKTEKSGEQKFFAVAAICLPLAALLFQEIYRDDSVNRRYTLLLLVFLAFYIPQGLESIASRLGDERNSRKFFLVMLFVGLAICSGKLLRIVPLGQDKAGFTSLSLWMRQNTNEDALVVSQQWLPRIAFYSQRAYKQLGGNEAPSEPDYFIHVVKEDSPTVEIKGKRLEEKYWVWENPEKKKEKVVIYELSDAGS